MKRTKQSTNDRKAQSDPLEGVRNRADTIDGMPSFRQARTGGYLR